MYVNPLYSGHIWYNVCVKIFGLIIERSRGRQVGSIEAAIIDLQNRVDKLEARRKVQVQEKEHESVVQTEIDKILSQGTPAKPGDMWGTL